MTTTITASIVQLLVETCKDGQESFAIAAGEIHDPAIKTALHDLAGQRAKFAEELAQVLCEIGEDSESSGSLIASLDRSWLDFRLVLSAGDEPTILANCQQTQARALAEYREALGAPELHPRIRGVVEQQHAAIEASPRHLRIWGRGA